MKLYIQMYLFGEDILQKTFHTDCHNTYSRLNIDRKNKIYRQGSNIRRTLVDNEFADHSDVVGASPVGAAPTTSSS